MLSNTDAMRSSLMASSNHPMSLEVAINMPRRCVLQWPTFLGAISSWGPLHGSKTAKWAAHLGTLLSQRRWQHTWSAYATERSDLISISVFFTYLITDAWIIDLSRRGFNKCTSNNLSKNFSLRIKKITNYVFRPSWSSSTTSTTSLSSGEPSMKKANSFHHHLFPKTTPMHGMVKVGLWLAGLCRPYMQSHSSAFCVLTKFWRSHESISHFYKTAQMV